MRVLTYAGSPRAEWREAPDPRLASAQGAIVRLYAKDVTFRTGRASVGPHIAEVLALVAAGRVDPGRIATVARWDDAPDVLSTRAVKPVLVRAV